MWMEENIGKKVNTERSQEAIATGASRVAVACPFCYVMFDDGVKGEGKDEEVKVQDIAEILWEAIENEDTQPRRSAGSSTSVSDRAGEPAPRSARGLDGVRFVDLGVREQLAPARDAI